MTNVNCDRQNRIHVRNKREQKIIIRCADVASPHFTREVSNEQCEQCPRKKVVVEVELKPLSVVRRAATYVKAVAGWVAKGSPERTDEEVQRIFHTLCEPCNWYKKQRCQKCGCKVRQDGAAMLNKIKMATEHCPVDRW